MPRPLSTYSDISSDCGSSASGWSNGPPPGSYDYDRTSPNSNFKRSWPNIPAFQTWLRDHEAKIACKLTPGRKEKSKGGQFYAWKRRYGCSYRRRRRDERDSEIDGVLCPSVLVLKSYPGVEEVRGYVTEPHNHKSPSKGKKRREGDSTKGARKARQQCECEDDDDDDECGSALIFINELIGINKDVDALQSYTNPIHLIIAAFLTSLMGALISGKRNGLTEEIEDALDAIRMYCKGVICSTGRDDDEGREGEGRDCDWEIDVVVGPVLDAKKVEKRMHEGQCEDCRERVLMESRRKRRCVGAARELEDRLLETKI